MTASSSPSASTPPATARPGSDAAAAYPPYRPWTRARVVVHSVPDSPSGYAGNGMSATQAVYYFLGRRLHLQVLPSGVGLAPPQIAADEAWRLGARAVVMARLEALDYVATTVGTGVRCRLEVMVVRDGRVVLRRVVESAPAPLPTPGSRRGRELDPVFVGVSQSLESIAGELSAAIGG
jgi:hypothetical protein